MQNKYKPVRKTSPSNSLQSRLTIEKPIPLLLPVTIATFLDIFKILYFLKQK